MNPAMRSLWQRHGLTALLGFAAVACLIALGVETHWGQAIHLPLPVANAAGRASDMVATLPAFGLPPLDIAFKESGERPLFTPTRRPAPVNSASAPIMKRGQFKLSGTSISNELTVAFLFEIATGKTVRVAKGKEINGMILDTVDAGRAVLKLGDETEELALRTAASPPVARVTVPAPSGVPAGAGGQLVEGANPPSVAQPSVMPPRPLMPQPTTAASPVSAAPGTSVLPGFVMPASPAAAQTQAPTDGSSPGQRRRRNPSTPQQ